MSRIELSVDGRTVRVRAGASLLSAARAAGVDVPTLCHLEGQPSRAVCRLCLVEVEGRARPVASCRTAAEPAMVVRTGGDHLAAARRTIMGFTLAEHGPCDRPGCPICALGARLGAAPDAEVDRRAGLDFGTDYLHAQPDGCVHCDRCIRSCDRGVIRRVGGGGGVSLCFGPEGGALADAACVACGDCLVACPAGVLRPTLTGMEYTMSASDPPTATPGPEAAPGPAGATAAAAPPEPAGAAAPPPEPTGAAAPRSEASASRQVPTPPASVDDAPPADEGRRRGVVSLFIAAVVLSQLLLPATYYVGDDAYDERFAWRMFSPIRVTPCQYRWFEGAERRPFRPDDVQAVWRSLMRRGRLDVVHGYARRRCEAIGPGARIAVELTCYGPGDRVDPVLKADQNLCEAS
jgi:ferredoxin